MNKACNFCDDVTAETADASFGDAWVEPYASDGKGTNVVVIRSSTIADLVSQAIHKGKLQLSPVDSQFVADTQAAGLRQRREGLANRLPWRNGGFRHRKRVPPDSHNLTGRRKLIYRLRYLLSLWTHRIFWFSRLTRTPQLYIYWAGLAKSLYHTLTYHRGKIGRIIKRHLG